MFTAYSLRLFIQGQAKLSVGQHDGTSALGDSPLVLCLKSLLYLKVITIHCHLIFAPSILVQALPLLYTS
jgi:hypothetical protein